MDVENQDGLSHRRDAASTYHCEAGESASEAVIWLVASRSDEEPFAIEPPLYDAIDPDALDELFVDASGQWVRPSSQIEFPYRGYQVEVRGDGRVTVRDGTEGYHL